MVFVVLLGGSEILFFHFMLIFPEIIPASLYFPVPKDLKLNRLKGKLVTLLLARIFHQALLLVFISSSP
jgi:hypothetical protein